MEFKDVVIYTDIDGTIASSINKEALISDKTLAAIQEFMDLGGHFGVASGRNHDSIDRLLKGIKVNMPYVEANGASVYDALEDKYIFESYIDEEDKALFYKFFDEQKILMLTMDASGSKQLKFNDERDVKYHYPFRQLIEYETFIKQNYFKLVAYAADNIEQLQKQVDERLNKEKYISISSGPHFVEVVDLHASKGNGALKAIEEKKLKDKFIVCMGDYDNDISLLEIANLAVCPSNANDKVKSICDYISVDKEHDVLIDVLNYIKEL